jgi:hypothetical protein
MRTAGTDEFRCGLGVTIRIILALMCAAMDAQPPSACALTGQVSEKGKVDPDEIQFISNPGPPTLLGKSIDMSFDFEGRVVNLRPLFIEILQSGAEGCGTARIFFVDIRLETVVKELQFGDFVEGKMMFAAQGLKGLVVKELRRSTAHSLTGDESCPSRSGTLVSYGQPGDMLVLGNDLSIYYRTLPESFERQKVSPDDLNRLMQSFRDVAFDSLPSLRWTDDSRGRAALTLTCGRRQSVLVNEYAARLAPVIENLERIKARVLENSYFLLSYREKREVTFLEWPLTDVPLDQLEQLKSQAMRRPPDPRAAEVVHRLLPQEFLAKLPSNTALPGTDTLYVRSGARIFRVLKDANPRPGAEGTAAQVGVREVLPVAGGFWTRPFDDVIEPVAPFKDPACALLSPAAAGLIWPDDAGTRLAQVPAAGKRIDREEFDHQRALYMKLYTSSCSSGFNFIEANYLYSGVEVKRVEAVPR